MFPISFDSQYEYINLLKSEKEKEKNAILLNDALSKQQKDRLLSELNKAYMQKIKDANKLIFSS